MRADTAEIVWPADLLDDEEQDEPLAGQDHRDTIDNLHYPFRIRLAGEDCFVAAELRVHRNRHDLRDWREPDVLVAFGVPDRIRRRYLIWEEGKAPDLVLEVLSPSSAENGDLTKKREWYRQIGVQEYVVLDPSGEFAPEPRMQAWRFGPLAAHGAHVLADTDGVLRSALIPFGWRVEEDWVRTVDLATGELCPTILELEPRLREAIRARQEAKERAQQLEEQALLLEERARQAQRRAEAEAQARQTLEEELQRLRRQLDQQA